MHIEGQSPVVDIYILVKYLEALLNHPWREAGHGKLGIASFDVAHYRGERAIGAGIHEANGAIMVA